MNAAALELKADLFNEGLKTVVGLRRQGVFTSIALW